MLLLGTVGRRAKYDLVYNIPGLTRQQAQNRAQQLLGEFSRELLASKRVLPAAATVVMQERTSLPSTRTEHAPHCASPHPNCGLITSSSFLST